MSEIPKISALVVDDEKLARANLKAALMQESKWQVLGECNRGDQVMDSVMQILPDVVFLDIRMPGMDGLSVCQQLQSLEKPPFIVFVTAFDAHAVEAFELCALDYLLKPFDDDRFQKTLERVEAALKNLPMHHNQVSQLQKIAGDQTEPLSNLVVRSIGRIQLVDIQQVDWVASAGNYVELHLGEQVILHRVSLSYLEKHLPKTDFLRIHRTALVRVSLVSEFLTLSDGHYQVILTTGDKVSVSQTHKEALLKRLGIE